MPDLRLNSAYQSFLVFIQNFAQLEQDMIELNICILVRFENFAKAAQLCQFEITKTCISFLKSLDNLLFMKSELFSNLNLRFSQNILLKNISGRNDFR
jgi:hypothetical protein